MKRILGTLATLVLGVALMGCIGDGTHVVGTGIQPGTYQNSDSSQGCYWERLSGFGGTVEEIIANGFTYGPAVVTVSSTDAGFTSARCGFWTQVANAPTVAPTVVQPMAQPTQIAPTRTPRPTREPDWNLEATCIIGSYDAEPRPDSWNQHFRSPIGHQDFWIGAAVNEGVVFVSGSFDVPDEYDGNVQVWSNGEDNDSGRLHVILNAETYEGSGGTDLAEIVVQCPEGD